jgi:hypothetical protein
LVCGKFFHNLSLVYQSAYFFALYGQFDITFFVQVENAEFKLIFKAKGKSGCIHKLQTFVYGFPIRNLFNQHSLGVFTRIAVVDSINLRGFKHNVGLDLARSQRCGSISRKEGVPRAARKNNYAALFQMSDGLSPDKGLGQLVNIYRG